MQDLYSVKCASHRDSSYLNQSSITTAHWRSRKQWELSSAASHPSLLLAGLAVGCCAMSPACSACCGTQLVQSRLQPVGRALDLLRQHVRELAHVDLALQQRWSARLRSPKRSDLAHMAAQTLAAQESQTAALTLRSQLAKLAAAAQAHSKRCTWADLPKLLGGVRRLASALGYCRRGVLCGRLSIVGRRLGSALDALHGTPTVSNTSDALVRRERHEVAAPACHPNDVPCDWCARSLLGLGWE